MFDLYKLSSGWFVRLTDSLSFTAPDGVIYDRCGPTLFSRCPGSRYPDMLDIRSIFTNDEWELYYSGFYHNEL